MKPEWKELRRKPSVENLRKRLGHLYKTHKEYERVMARMLELTKEKVENTLHGKDQQEETDLGVILELVEKQREALADNFKFELKRLYRFLETVNDADVKLILTLRHAHFLSWSQIAQCIGGGLTVRRVRDIHEQFILEHA